MPAGNTPVTAPVVTVNPAATVKSPADDKDIVSAAVSLDAVLKLNLVALDETLKSPSDIAEIPAATFTASVPFLRQGLENLLYPKYH